MVTNSRSADDVTGASRLLRSSGVPVFTVAYGDAIDKNELETIATESDNVIIAPEVTELPKTATHLASMISESTKEGNL